MQNENAGQDENGDDDDDEEEEWVWLRNCSLQPTSLVSTSLVPIFAVVSGDRMHVMLYQIVRVVAPIEMH